VEPGGGAGDGLERQGRGELRSLHRSQYR
jgi:hypothetical protein